MDYTASDLVRRPSRIVLPHPLDKLLYRVQLVLLLDEPPDVLGAGVLGLGPGVNDHKRPDVLGVHGSIGECVPPTHGQPYQHAASQLQSLDDGVDVPLVGLW